MPPRRGEAELRERDGQNLVRRSVSQGILPRVSREGVVHSAACLFVALCDCLRARGVPLPVYTCGGAALTLSIGAGCSSVRVV
jgi:hypothetical protein